MLHGFEERFPTRVLVWPVRVQGRPAPPRSRPPSAASTRSRRGPVPRPDVLIVARGGGSLEDLWGFNDEAVVRAAAESAIPLIPRLGTRRTGRCWTTPPTRAPTPTKAAEWAVPIFADLAEDLPSSGCAYRSDCAASSRAPGPPQGGGARAAATRGSALAAAPALRCRRRPPRALLPRLAAEAPYAPCATPRPATGRRFARPSAAPALRGLARAGSAARSLPTRGCTPPAMRGWPGACGLPCSRGGFCAAGSGSTHSSAVRAARAWRRDRAERGRLAAQSQLLTSLSYQSALRRGFAIVRDAAGAMRMVAQVGARERLELELADGRVPVEALGRRRPRPAAHRAPRAPPKGARGESRAARGPRSRGVRPGLAVQRQRSSRSTLTAPPRLAISEGVPTARPHGNTPLRRRGAQ